MSINLTGKVALVTGGSKGIGAATCRALAKAGASVVVNYSSDSSAADSLVNEIGSKKALAVKADASSVKGAEEMVKATMDRFGQLDIVIANAGVLPMKTVEDTTEKDFDSTFALNVKGPYFLVQVSDPVSIDRSIDRSS
jgi:3-oxoacyl-[acyl-carrier protein] reductase